MDLTTLNPVQREAVQAVDGPVLILAGAGSGKTRVLTQRIAWLLDQGYCRPWQVLALTFTNKAAREMKERIAALVGQAVDEMWVGTFHSLFARILRREADLLGYDRQFSIYDSDDQLKLIKQCMEHLELSTNRVNPKGTRARISDAKNAMLDPDAFEAMDSGFVHEQLVSVYREYNRRLKQANAMDFDDLLLRPIDLFRQHPDRLSFYQNRFRYILIDEYQDTNAAQFEVTRLLASDHGNLCVVGDDDQSIYGWRGADIGNILGFEEHWPAARVFKLEQNYRSTETILNAAHAVVSQNEGRKDKKLWTDNGKGDPITLLAGDDEKGEAALVLQEVRKGMQKGRALSEYAVLYRTNAQSRALEEAFRRNAMRYQIVGGTRFYERREVKDVLAYLHLLTNPDDTISLTRVVNYPRRGIGDTSFKRLLTYAYQRRMNVTQLLSGADGVEGIGPKVARALESFSGLLSGLRQRLAGGEAVIDVFDDLLEQIKLEEALLLEGPEGKDRLENVRELRSSLADYCENSDLGLPGFLEEVALVSDIDSWDDSGDHVTLMTAHAAKGLEFNTVFVTGLEEGLFPLGNSWENPDGLEEERRLFYVACTRARKELYLCHASWRRRFGGSGQPGVCSSFVDLIPEDLIEHGGSLQGGFFTGGRNRVSAAESQRDASSRDTNRRRRSADSQGLFAGERKPRRTGSDQGPPPMRVGPKPVDTPLRRSQEQLLNKYSPFRSGASGSVDYEGLSQEPEISDPDDIGIGSLVLHSKYGQGKVINRTGFGAETRFTVRFDSVGVKKMVAKFAKLRLQS